MNYLDEVRHGVKARPIPWEGYVRANLLTADEASPFKQFEKSTPAERDAAVKAAPGKYVEAITQILGKCGQDDVIKFVVLFTSEIVEEVPEFRTAFASADAPWSVLTKLLAEKANDNQIGLLVDTLLVDMANAQLAPPKSLSKLLEYIAKLVNSDNATLQDLGVQQLSTLLQTKQYRSEFWSVHSLFIESINKLVKSPSAGGLQVQYYALLVIWLSSFDPSIAQSIVVDYDTVDVVLNAAKTAVKEKIARVSVATLLNLVKLAPKVAPTSIIAHRGLATITALADRKWNDEELKEDVEELRNSLTSSFNDMSTFDVYLNELETKHLLWSPPHRSAAFWKANVAEFHNDNFKVFRKLIRLLLSSGENDYLTQAVACNDIAAIVAEDPEATSVLQEEHAKSYVMNLMDSPDPEVRYEALKATQAFIAKLFKA